MSCYFCSSGSYEFTESLDKIAERKLGLTSGVEMAKGLKPTTARETLVNHFLNEREKEFVDIEPLRYVWPEFFYFLFYRFFSQQVSVGGRNKNKNKIHSDHFPIELKSKETQLCFLRF